MKKIIVGLLSFAFLLVGQSVFASVSWNTDPYDCPGSGIGNYSDPGTPGIPPVGSNDCWNLSSVPASSGDSVNVQLYYHNTGTQPATGTKVFISVSPAMGTVASTHTFTSSLTANPTGTPLGTTQVTLSTPQALSFGHTCWYPNQGSNCITSGSEITTSSGLSLGTVMQGWGGQGTVVASFLVGTTIVPPPQTCTTSISASSTSIQTGGSTTITWSSTSGCNNVYVSGPNLNSSNSSGSSLIYPTNSSNTYTITANGPNGAYVAPKSVTVNVTQNLTCATTISASSTSIQTGGSTTITWSSTSGCNNVYVSGPNLNSSNSSGSQTVSPTNQSNTYTITANGPNGAYVIPQSVVVNVSQALGCNINSNLSASPTSIQSGGSSILNWGTSNCSVVVSGPNFSSTSQNGPQTVSPPTASGTYQYTLTAIGTNSPAQTQSVYITVAQTAQACSISGFTVNGSSTTTIQSGGAVNIVWNTSNCSSVNVLGPNFSNNSLSYNNTIYPTSSGTYTITATGTNGAYIPTQSVYVVVNQTQNCSISNFTANGSSSTTVQSGGSVNLVWNTNNCSSVIVSGLNFNSSSVNGNQTIYPTSSGTYTITATGASGSYVAPQSVYVNVNNTQNSNCYISNFTANGSSSTSILSGGAVNLVWSTSGNNCSVTVSGPNFTSSSTYGNQTIYPTYSGTYTLVVYGTGTGTQTQSVYVTVNNYQYNNCAISYFTASPTSITYGGLSTLSWSTSGCSSVSITNIGSVNSYGSQSVYPTYTTSYTISAYGTNGAATSQTVQVYVSNYVAPPAPVNACAVTTIATNITRNSVTLNGLVTNSNSYSADTYFEYGTDVTLGLRTSSKSTNGNNSFSETLTGLSPNTIYFYRLVSNCNNGIGRGSIEIFQTSGAQTNTTTIIRQGTTVIGTESPIMLKIENKYQGFRVGDNVDYTITYKNISKKTLTHAMLQVILPKGITYLNSSRGTYKSDTYTLTVPLEDLYAGVEGVVYLQARVDSITEDNAQIVTTALLVYTTPNNAQENAMAYVLNNPVNNNNFSLGAAALFGSMFGMGIIGWMILLILILLAILLFRKIYRKQ